MKKHLVADLLLFAYLPLLLHDFTESRVQVFPIALELHEPRKVILVEGILIFVDKTLREMMDIKIYVDAPADLRFIRRLKRDVMERGRSVDLVIDQYLGTVRPMHLDFVEPSKRYADVIIPRGGRNIKAIQMLVAQIQRMLAEESAR